MRKTYLTFGLFSLILTAVFVSGCGNSSPVPDVYHTVTFKQENVDDFVIKVKKGEDLLSVPSPVGKTGYTTIWDRVDFTNITEDIVVNSLSSANTYTVTYRAQGFAIDGTKVMLTYDSLCSSLDMSLTKEDAICTGWVYNNTTYTNESIWNIANDVTITPKWVEKNKVSVIFIDTDGTAINKTLYKGGTLTDIPTPSPQVGYTNISWDRTDFTNITENIVVHALKTAKTYTVNFDPNGGTISQEEVIVTFDQPYSFEKPLHSEYQFSSWKYNGEDFPISGIWIIDVEKEINLVAEWGDSNWTIIY